MLLQPQVLWVRCVLAGAAVLLVADLGVCFVLVVVVARVPVLRAHSCCVRCFFVCWWWPCAVR